MMRVRGFTLVEILIVIAIIGILSAMIIVGVTGAQRRAQDTQVMSRLDGLASALAQFEVDRRQYPIFAETTADSRGGVPISNLSGMLTPHYLRAGSPVFNFGERRARYLSTLDGKSFRMAVELSNPIGTTVTTGNGVYSVAIHSTAVGDNSITIPGQRLSGLRLDGGQAIAVGTAGAANVAGTQLTISLWVRNPTLAALGPQSSTVFANADRRPDGSHTGYALQFRRRAPTEGAPQDHHFSFLWGDGTPNTNLHGAHWGFTPTEFANIFGSWTHLAIVKNGDSNIFYLNGEARPPGPLGNSRVPNIVENNQIFRISFDPLNSGLPGFTGELDDLRIYSRALTPPEIAGLYNNGSGQFSTYHDTRLVLGLRLDEGAGTTIHDFKTGSTTGTITSQPGRSHSWVSGVSSSGLSDLCSAHPCLNGLNSRAFVVYGPQ